MPKRKQSSAAIVRTARLNGIARHAPSLFLDLPPELRNNVYELLLSDVKTIWVLPKGQGYTTSDHPVHFVCKQVHKEFGGLLSQVAPETATFVIGEVVDFDYGALITFLNRVKKNPKAKLCEFDLLDTRRLLISMSITNAWCENPDAEKLLRWHRWTAGVGVHVFSEMRFDYIEDKELARKTLDSLVSDDEATGSWNPVLNIFVEWYMTGRNVVGDEGEEESEEDEGERFEHDEEREDFDGYVI